LEATSAQEHYSQENLMCDVKKMQNIYKSYLDKLEMNSFKMNSIMDQQMKIKENFIRHAKGFSNKEGFSVRMFEKFGWYKIYNLMSIFDECDCFINKGLQDFLADKNLEVTEDLIGSYTKHLDCMVKLAKDQKFENKVFSSSRPQRLAFRILDTGMRESFRIQETPNPWAFIRSNISRLGEILQFKKEDSVLKFGPVYTTKLRAAFGFASDWSRDQKKKEELLEKFTQKLLRPFKKSHMRTLWKNNSWVKRNEF
jgi:hypothetical protein